MMSDEILRQQMTDAHTIAVVGVSDSPENQSFQVAAYQQSQGYKVIPVNPKVKTVLGQPAVDNLSQVDDRVDIVDVFSGQELDNVIDQAVAKQAKVLWLQRGVHDAKAEQMARSRGLEVVSDRCFMAEHRRLLSDAPM